MDMVEKVAQAVCLTQWGGYPMERGEREAWPQWAQALKVARAAIEAMREPTEAMIAAGAWSNYGWTREQSIERGKEAVYDEYASNAASIYRDIIDAALKEQEKVG